MIADESVICSIRHNLYERIAIPNELLKLG